MYFCFKLGKGFFGSVRHAPNAVDSDDCSSGTMHYTLGVKDLIDEFQLSSVKHVVEVAPYQLLVCRAWVREYGISGHLDSTYHVADPPPRLDGTHEASDRQDL